MDVDRDLAFGILAVQLNCVNRLELSRVSSDWACDPSRTLSHHLCKSGTLSEADAQFIDRVLDSVIALDRGGASATLERLGGEAQIHDSFLGTISKAPGGLLHSTLPNMPLGRVPKNRSDAGLNESPGRYAHIGEHARGGMGRVLVVYDQFLGREVALKELLPVKGVNVDGNTPVEVAGPIMARFLHEARITGQLEHPSIVPVYELGHRTDGSLYYTMRLVRGKTLHEAIKAAGTLEERLDLLPHFVDLCNAIAYAHSRHVIHRDIKPGNVMVGEFGETVVLDWGLAKSKDYQSDTITPSGEFCDPADTVDDILLAKTLPGQALGTPVYMPPEQASGQVDRIDERSDVYSLGAVLYEVLANRAPYAGNSSKEVLAKVLTVRPEDLSQFDSRIPTELAAICRKAMARDPESRYQSAKELADEVQRFLSGSLVHAHTYHTSELLRRFVRRYKAVVITVCVGALTLASIGTYSYINIRSARNQEFRMRVASENRLYDVSMNFAQRNVEDARFDVARENLTNCPPELRDWDWGRLKYIVDATSVEMGGHAQQVIDGVYTPDGSRLLTYDEAGVVIEWDTKAHHEIMRVETGHGGFGKIALHPNGETFAACGGDGRVSMWDVKTGNMLRRWQGHEGNVQAIAFTSDGSQLLSGGDDETVRQWSSATGSLIRSIPIEGTIIQDIAVNGVGTLAAVGLSDGDLLVFDLQTGKTLWRIHAHPENLRAGMSGTIGVAFRPGHNQIATSGCDNCARLWEVETGAELQTFRGHPEKIWEVSFSGDGKRLATASSERRVRIWNPDTGVEIPSSFGSVLPLLMAVFSPDGAHLATGGTSTTVRIWDAGDPFGAFRLREHRADVNTVAFSNDDRTLATAGGNWATGGDSRVILWDRASRNVLRILDSHTGPVFTVAYHPNGRWVSSAGSDRRIITWDVESGAIVHEFTAEVHQNGVRSIAYDPSGKQLISGGWDGDDNKPSVAVIWDAEKGTPLHILEPHGGVLDTVAWSPDGSTVATGSRDGNARIWNPVSGKLLHTLASDDGWVYGLAYDSAGPRIATSHDSGAIYVWDLASGTRLKKLRGHANRANRLAYSPDGTRIASCEKNGGIYIWSPLTSSLLLTLDHEAEDLAFSHDGTTLATAGVDGTTVLWPSLPWK